MRLNSLSHPPEFRERTQQRVAKSRGLLGLRSKVGTVCSRAARAWICAEGRL
jgi:hypothetical protein